MALLDMFKGKHQKGSVAPRAAVKKPIAAKKPVKVTSKAKPKPKTAAKPAHMSAPKPEQKVFPAKPVPQPKLDDEKAWELLKQARFPIASFMFVRKETDVPLALKKVGIPAVMKVSGPNIIHKSDIGGIRKDISTEEQAKLAFTELMRIKGAEKVQFQRQLSGLELIVGAKSDSQFGTIVSVGLGGIYVELLKDVTFRIAPIGTDDALAMLKELKGRDILAGARGQAAIKLEAVTEVLVKLGKFAIAEKVREMDINPLFCSSEGCWAADVRIMK